MHVSSDPSVSVRAIGIGDMFDQVEENESLKSITCQRNGTVMSMKRFVDLVAEEFIDNIETVLCPGINAHYVQSIHMRDLYKLLWFLSVICDTFLFFSFRSYHRMP